VFVRLRFLLLLSSDSRLGIDTLAEEPGSITGAAGGGGLRSNCLVSLVGDAALLRGLGAAREGGLVSSVARGTIGTGEGGRISTDRGGDDALDKAVLGRLDGGGVLSEWISRYRK